MRPIRVDDSRSTSSEQALGQSCGQADFQNSLPINSPSWRFIRHIAGNPPLAVGLPTEHVQSGLLGLGDLRGALLGGPRRPDQPYDGHVPRDDDLLDVE